jgi:hypothetical protein
LQFQRVTSSPCRAIRTSAAEHRRDYFAFEQLHGNIVRLGLANLNYVGVVEVRGDQSFAQDVRGQDRCGGQAALVELDRGIGAWLDASVAGCHTAFPNLLDNSSRRAFHRWESPFLCCDDPLVVTSAIGKNLIHAD